MASKPATWLKTKVNLTIELATQQERKRNAKLAAVV